MSREIKQDFNKLVQFISQYNLLALESNKDFLEILNKQQKKYFAYLTYIAEIQNYVGDMSFSPSISHTQFSYVKESCSDVGLALFMSFNGGYKASKLLLRSSIETFLKGFTLDSLPTISEETSMYELFKQVRSLPFFNNDVNKKIINHIHNKYKLLCKDVHTATNINMANISSLNYFPSFNKTNADQISDFTLGLISDYLSLLILKYNSQYHKMHYKNKAIIIDTIPKKIRPLINNAE